jgi:hypothetical protein
MIVFHPARIAYEGKASTNYDEKLLFFFVGK